MSNKVIGPSIIAARVNARQLVWTWVEKVNKELSSAPLNVDDTISVDLGTHLTDDIKAQLLTLYTDAGWDITVTDSVFNFSTGAATTSRRFGARTN